MVAANWRGCDVAFRSLRHDRAILGRRDTMREKLITATRPTGQNYYGANPIGNELGTEPAPIRSACAATWSEPQQLMRHGLTRINDLGKSTPATINYSALQNVDLKNITDLSEMSKLG